MRALTILSVMLITLISARLPAWVEIGAVTEHSAGNWMRLETGYLRLPYAEGPTIRLTGERRGRPFQFDVTTDSPSGPMPVRPEVQEIRYMDENRVWLVVRLGHRLDAALLFDLDQGRTLRAYRGIDFTVSPGAQHIAFEYPGVASRAVFLDDAMVFPTAEGGVNHAPQAPEDPPGPRLSDGRSVLDLASHVATAEVIGPLRWSQGGVLEFMVREEGPTRGFCLCRARMETAALAAPSLGPGAPDTRAPSAESQPVPADIASAAVQRQWATQSRGGQAAWSSVLPGAVTSRFSAIPVSPEGVSPPGQISPEAEH
jgi:hypothetical protein